MKPAVKKLDMGKVQTPTRSALKSPINAGAKSPIGLKKSVSTVVPSEVVKTKEEVVEVKETYEETLARMALEKQRLEEQEILNEKMRERELRIQKFARMFGAQAYKVDSPRDCSPKAPF